MDSFEPTIVAEHEASSAPTGLGNAESPTFKIKASNSKHEMPNEIKKQPKTSNKGKTFINTHKLG